MDMNEQDILSDCLDRIAAGEPAERLIAAYPQYAASLAPLLPAAQRLADAQVLPPAAWTKERARQQMLTELEASTPPPRSGAAAWLAAFGARPAAFRGLAVAGTVALVGVLGLGAAAATGNGPEPVRQFLGVSSNRAIEVEFTGTIVSKQDDVLLVSGGGGFREVRIVPQTALDDGGRSLTLADLVAGDEIEVHGELQVDNTIIATRVSREDGDDDDNPSAGPTAGPTTDAPGAVPTVDDDADDDVDDDADDNSGPGNTDDDGDDNSGPGNADGDDNSGPGNDDDGGHGGDDEDDERDDD